jgi:hypothetical protein
LNVAARLGADKDMDILQRNLAAMCGGNSDVPLYAGYGRNRAAAIDCSNNMNRV